MSALIPRLQLVYFAVRARAEVPRMILEFGSIPYVDCPHSKYFDTSGWGESKAQTPFGQLPVLDVDGQALAQTGAIVRYCNSLVPELTPDDPFMAAKAESIYLTAEEMSRIDPLVNVYRGEKHAEIKAEYFSGVFPRLVSKIQQQIQSSGGPFTLGGKPHYGDLYVYHILSNALLVGERGG